MKLARLSSTLFAALGVAAITFSLAVSVQAQTESVLFSFTGTNGESPYSGMIFDNAGNLYGTTLDGGNFGACAGSGCGTVFKLSRSHTGAWKETVLHSFDDGRTGGFPYGVVVQDAAGNLYGTAAYGGLANGCLGPGCGVIYKLSPTSTGNWRETVLHTFTGGADGGVPQSGLILDAAGNLYGTTLFGGNTSDCPGSLRGGCGVVFEISPGSTGGWHETVLYAFTGLDDGGEPVGGLTFDAAGNLYGTTSFYGGSSAGTVFELSPSSGGWSLTTLHTFTGAPNDGAYPVANLIVDAAGNLYGTTSQGGNGGGTGAGTVFEVSPSSGGSWTETVLHSFSGLTDGEQPLSGVVFDGKGNLWGSTSGGGPDGHFSKGVVFELVPGSGGTWTETNIHDFRQGVGDGQYPYGELIFDKNGNVYGTTAFGGSANLGSVYKIAP